MSFSRKATKKVKVSRLAARPAFDDCLRPVLEMLESRVLLSSSISNGIVTVTGTNNADQITLSGDGVNVTVDVSGDQQQYAVGDVTRVNVTALDGDDTITLNAGSPVTQVNAGLGNDTILSSPT